MRTFSTQSHPRNKRYPSNPTHYLLVKRGEAVVRVDIYPSDFRLWQEMIAAGGGQIIAYLPLYETLIGYELRKARTAMRLWWDNILRDLDRAAGPRQEWDVPPFI